MLFLIFFPSASSEIDLSSSTASLTSSRPPKRRDVVIVGSTTLIALLVVGVTSIALVAMCPHRTQGWANLLGSAAGLLSTIQYLPQIWYTYQLGDIKSLSVVTMLIQVPGSFLWAFSLWQRVGTEGWSSWAVYLISGVLQGVLLSMAVSYWVANRGNTNKDESDDDSIRDVDDVDGTAGAEEHDERSALLGNGNGSKNGRPIAGTQRSNGERQFSMLYAATPPDS